MKKVIEAPSTIITLGERQFKAEFSTWTLLRIEEQTGITGLEWLSEFYNKYSEEKPPSMKDMMLLLWAAIVPDDDEEISMRDLARSVPLNLEIITSAFNELTQLMGKSNKTPETGEAGDTSEVPPIALSPE